MENDNYTDNQVQQEPTPEVVPEETSQENNQQQYIWHQDDYTANLNKEIEQPESVAEPHFTTSSAESYRENMKALKQEYKAAKKEERRNSSSGKTAFLSAVIAVACTLLTVCVALVFVAAFPTPGNSILGKYIRSMTNTTGDSSTETELSGGQFYSPNKETITINDETTDVCTAVYAKVSPSIVGIRIVQVGGSFLYPTTQVIGEGTGTVYSKDGLIITNYHVIENAIETQKGNNALSAAEYEVRVYFDTTLQEYYVAEIIGGDSRTDLALLKISLNNLVPVEFADSDEILVGSDAIVMGGGGGIEFIDSVNKGIISGLHRNITTDTGVIYDLIQTDAAINPGNSGGALLNSKGELIGICFLKISADAYDNMAFAIPSNTVKKIISQIEEDGSADSPYIGVSIDTTYTKQDADKFSYPQGALVGLVEENKSADRAGIKKGDIIIEFNGVTIKSYDDLRSAINKCQVGDEVTVKVFSTDTRKESSLKLTIDNYNS
ncbi:MAG: PDZ domain-containing protein [Ruminococcaceae bacterium]|nr:PDZ domain-containing protein [Oscillospiraceae bacterium]